MRPLPGSPLGNSVREFSEKGLIGPVRVFTPEQCKVIAAELTKKSRPKPADWFKGRAVTDRFWYDLGTRPAVLTLVSSMLGERAVLWGCSLVKRSPGKIHHWHTDIESSAERSGGFVSVWIGLENTCKQSALKFVTCSHLFGKSIQEVYHEQGFRRDDVTSDQVLTWAKEFAPEAEIVQPELGDGEAVAFDGRVWHASQNSRSTGTRLALLLQYADADARVRIPDFEHLEWPFRFLDEPLPQVIEVSGSGTKSPNKTAQPPAADPNSGALLFSATHTLPLPLPENEANGWRPHHIFRGNTPVLDFLSCHMSILSPGHSPHPPHAHKGEELLVVLDGKAELVINDSDTIEGAHSEPLESGAFVYYPPNQHHTIRNTSKAPVTYLMLIWHTDAAGTDRPSAPAVFHYDSLFERTGPQRSRHIVKMPTPYLGRLSAHVTVLQPGSGYDPHIDAYDVVILLLSGSVETIGRRVSARSVIFYQAGEPHGMRNVGDAPARYLVFEFHPGTAQVKTSTPARAEGGEAKSRTGRQTDQTKIAMEAIKRERDAAREDVKKLRRYADALRVQLRAVLGSRSWNIMRPYRFAGNVLLRLITGKWNPPSPLLVRPVLSSSKPAQATYPKAVGKVTRGDTDTQTRKRRTDATKLEDKLWGGFSRYARQELETLKVSPVASRDDAVHAAWVLALWFASHGEHKRALENLDVMQGIDVDSKSDVGWLFLKADCLTRLGQGVSARSLLINAIRLKPGSATLCLAMANTFIGSPEHDHVRLGWINRVYEHAGLLLLTKADPAAPLTFQNLKRLLSQSSSRSPAT